MTVQDIQLCSTENGAVYQCDFFSLVVLTFKGHWIVFDLHGYLRFRNLVGLAQCPKGRRMLAGEDMCLMGENEGHLLRLGTAEMEELIGLLDKGYSILSTRRIEVDWTKVGSPVRDITMPLIEHQ